MSTEWEGHFLLSKGLDSISDYVNSSACRRTVSTARRDVVVKGEKVTFRLTRSIRVLLPCNSHRGERGQVRGYSSSFQYQENPIPKIEMSTKGSRLGGKGLTEMMM